MSGKVLGCSKSVWMVSDVIGMSFDLGIVNLHFAEKSFWVSLGWLGFTMAFGANLAQRAGSSTLR